MNARLVDYRMLWRAALSHSNPLASAIVRWGGASIALLYLAMDWYNEGTRAALLTAWVLACGAVLATWTWRFVPGAVKLASPADAKLVPGLRKRLMELACVVWVGAMAGIALTAWFGLGPIGIWLVWIMLGTVGSALSVAGHQAGGAMIFVACFGSVFLDDVPDSVKLILSGPPAVALALLACAGLIVVAVREIFPQAGDRHWRMIERRVRILAAPGKPDPLLDHLAGTRARSWYVRSLRQDCKRRDSRQLVLHALGPASHIGEMAMGLALFAVVLVVLGTFTTWRTGGDVVKDLGWLFASVLIFVPVATALRLNGLVAAHPDEQALVRLAPAMPGEAAPFNRHLGRALLRQAFMGWCLTAGTAMLLAALAGADPGALVSVASICCLVLPIMAAPLRNHALDTAPPALMSLLLLAAAIGASLVSGYALRAVSGLPLLPLLPVAAGVSVAIAAAAVARGLRMIERFPVAFPARRLD